MLIGQADCRSDPDRRKDPMSLSHLHLLPRVKWIFDPAFHYTPSFATDLAKTFERVRRHIESQRGVSTGSGNGEQHYGSGGER